MTDVKTITRDEADKIWEENFSMLPDGKKSELYNIFKDKNDKEGKIDEIGFRQMAEQLKKDWEKEKEQAAVIHAEALKIINSGEVFDYILKSCEKRHVCHSEIERNILSVEICSCASMLISNVCGICPNLSGEAGVGKSDSATVVADHYDQDHVIDGYMSKTALQHMKLNPMTIVIRDDQAMTGETVDIFNASLSKWDEDYVFHITNPKTHKVEDLPIPRRCARWTIYAHGTGNDQNHDRQIFLHPDGSSEQRKCVHDKIIRDYEDPFITLENTTVYVSREIWRIFFEDAPYIVKVPFAHRIKCDEGEGNRTFKMMICLTACFTVMAKEKRETIKSPDGEHRVIVSTEDDFKRAAKIMNKLIQGKGGSQKHKLTPTAEKILDFLMINPPDTWKGADMIPFRDVRNSLSISSSALSKSLDGLLEIVGIGVDNEGSILTPKAKAFIIDRNAFREWEGSHGLYILGEEEDTPGADATAQDHHSDPVDVST